MLKYGLMTGVDMPDAIDRAMRARPSWPGHARTKPPGTAPDRHARGPTVEIEPARVRYQLGAVTDEPVLSVVVRGPRRFALRVRDDLVRRGAEVVTVTFNPTGFIARAQVTQAELLGYPAWLGALMGGRAKLLAWLSHYAPLDQGPGPEAA